MRPLPRPMAAVLLTLLPLVAHATDAPVAKSDGNPSVTIESPEKGVNVTKNLQSEETRQAWMKHGGWLTSYEASGLFTYRRATIATLTLSGAGGGGSFRFGLLRLVPPDLTRGGANWFGFKVGLGFDASFVSNSVKVDGVIASGSKSSTTVQMNVPLSVGIFGALGHFDDDGGWRGLTVALSYEPALGIAVQNDTNAGAPTGPGPGRTGSDAPDTHSTSTKTSVNPVGLRLDFGYKHLDSPADAVTKQAQFTANVIFLPPIGPFPLILSIGAGANWY